MFTTSRWAPTEKAAQIIDGGAKSFPEVIAKVVYVLVKLCSVPRERINDIVSPITEEIEFENSDIIKNDRQP